MLDALAAHLSENLRVLRDKRGMTQQQLAKLAGVPRATLANAESGGANPTLGVLARLAAALQVSIEELLAAPRAEARRYPAGSLPQRTPTGVVVRKLLPDRIPAMEMDRLELQPGARLTGVPHTPGTREYLTCESGTLVVTVAGVPWTLFPGDVVVFPGDRRHGYHNPGPRPSVGYSVVALAPMI